MTSNSENASIWWRHHVIGVGQKLRHIPQGYLIIFSYNVVILIMILEVSDAHLCRWTGSMIGSGGGLAPSRCLNQPWLIVWLENKKQTSGCMYDIYSLYAKLFTNKLYIDFIVLIILLCMINILHDTDSYIQFDSIIIIWLYINQCPVIS